MEPRGLVRVGRCGRPHGIRGEITVHLDNPGSDALARVSDVVIVVDGSHETFGVSAAARRDGSRFLLALEGVSTRRAASALTNGVVMVRRSDLGLGEDDLLVSDLPGRRVVEAGRVVGTVRSAYWNGAHEVIVVETDRGLVDFPLVEAHVAGSGAEGFLEVSGFDDFAELAYPPNGEGET